MTGADVSHLLLYPTTGLDRGTDRKMSTTAHAWGLGPTTQAPRECRGLRFDVARHVLTDGGQDFALGDRVVEWDAAALAQGFVVLSVSLRAVSAPTLEVIGELLARPESGALLYGLVPAA